MENLEGANLWLSRFATVRSRLYRLSLAFYVSVFALLVMTAVLTGASAPRILFLDWLF